MKGIDYKIINGDCLEVMKTLADDSVDCVITSPPYNLNRRMHYGEWCVNKDRSKYGDFYHDALPIDEYFEWQLQVITECLRITKTYVFFNIQMVTGNKPALFRLIGHFADSIKEIIIWDKLHAEPAVNSNVLNSQFEFIFCFAKSNTKTRQFEICNFGRGAMANLIKVPKNTGNPKSGNLATYPIEIPTILIRNFTSPGALILDPFSGTGSTGVSCALTSRDFIGIELISHFCEVSEARIKRALGQPCDLPQRTVERDLPLFQI